MVFLIVSTLAHTLDSLYGMEVPRSQITSQGYHSPAGQPPSSPLSQGPSVPAGLLSERLLHQLALMWDHSTCRFLERAIIWQYLPQDNMILKEMEVSAGGLPGVSNWQTQKRLTGLGVTDEAGRAQGSHIDAEAGYTANANFDHTSAYHKRGQAASKRRSSLNGNGNEVQMSNRGLAFQGSNQSDMPFMTVE